MKKIVLSESVKFPPEDYTHSSNSLFHFMKKQEYLYNALINKALIPRYCLEDIEYLSLSSDNKPFNQMAVLMKCFCDIPLHRITQKYDFKLDHTSLYGEYAISFSKAWGEDNGIQPIMYMNKEAKYLVGLCNVLNTIISEDVIIPEAIVNNYMLQLAFLKPLRGTMSRKNEIITKNFYDEQEWRYVPFTFFDDNEFAPVLANPALLSNRSEISLSPIDLMSDKLCEKEYQEYWLDFSFDDVKYIIVPNKQARIDLVKYILEMTVAFNNEEEKYILISKILVLDEIRKDW